ncbi:kinase-like domain-containing protein [Aspergillus carlsbadensis]|nr:kinase-like domain-containing protein [Aspergillus carlsbadensis]
MDLSPSELLVADESSLIALCRTAAKEGHIIGGHVGGDHVVRISDTIAVKYGLDVSASEAVAQRFAYEVLRPGVVQVPKVHRFFISTRPGDPVGYLFMEYIPGRTPTDDDLDPGNENCIIPRITSIINSLGNIHSSTPGPVGGGCPKGYIFGDDGASAPLASIDEVSTYLDKRLEYRSDTIDLSPYPLIFCHGDICRRNILVKDDGSLYLVDWGYAGFYPRFSELLALSFVTPFDATFVKPLKEEVLGAMDLAEAEQRDMKLVSFVRGANLRWSFDDRSPTEVESYHESLKKAFSSSRPLDIEATNPPAKEDAVTEPRSNGKDREEPNT